MNTQKERYIKHIKDLYYKDVEDYRQRMLSPSSIYKNDPEYTEHKPNPPYKIDEIPDWYPEVLKLYLTEVSCEMLKDGYPCKIHLHDKNKSLHTIQKEAVEQYFKEIGSTEEEQKQYFDYELKYNNNTLEALIEIGKRLEVINSTSLTIGIGGCSSEYIYCPILDKVMWYCSDTFGNNGIVQEYKDVIHAFKHGISLEDYIFKK